MLASTLADTALENPITLVFGLAFVGFSIYGTMQRAALRMKMAAKLDLPAGASWTDIQ